MTYIAHSKNDDGHRQELQQHLQEVAELAAQFATSFGASDYAYSAGLWHDIGKFNPAFQRYLKDAELDLQGKKRGPEHKGAGAVLARDMKQNLIAFLIAGHHGGLPSKAELEEWLEEKEATSHAQKAIHTAKQIISNLYAAPQKPVPTHIHSPHEVELFIRMLFSALVDADFLNTEEHFQIERSTDRGKMPSLPNLWTQFEANQRQFSACEQTAVNIIRNTVYQDCLKAAELTPGFFRLTVPTGGGKTRSSLAFSLSHALKHGQERIIYAIPYTSITEQTTDEFRKIFPDERVILEHHSAITSRNDPDNPTREEVWRRLASENWDARLIVTTTVQFFQSLMSRTPSACRKLHNIARSVIILDEAQMLPTHLLEPILDVLRQLVTHYGATVILCTATQPALDDRLSFKGLEDVREIITEPEKLFTALKRVQYQLPHQKDAWTWSHVANKVRESHQALVVVNTRADALKVVDALCKTGETDDSSIFHLSTRMCGVHRRDVLKEVRRRLDTGEACHLISTQMIEAGVDVDFPLVLRAVGPLDRIVQAAGRCNREGRLPVGTVIVFHPEKAGIPPGPYRTGTDVTSVFLQNSDLDLHDPSLYQRYFERYYAQVDRDKEGIQNMREDLDYPTVAKNFRMIEDDTTSVVVRYPDKVQSKHVADLLQRLQHRPSRSAMRGLQPYIVSLRPRELTYAQQRGLVAPVIPEVWEWVGKYDRVRGIVLDGLPDVERFVW